MLKKNKRKLEVKNNAKIDDWLIKVRVVEEKTVKIRTKTEVHKIPTSGIEPRSPGCVVSRRSN